MMGIVKRKDLLLSLAACLFLLTGWLLEHGLPQNHQILARMVYVASYVAGGYLMAIDLAKNLLRGKLDIDLLMTLAAIGAAILGRWAEGALLLFLFSLGHALEHLALDRANSSIAALAKLKPVKALVRKHNQIVEVPVEQLRSGDRVVIRPDTTISADGIVVEGYSNVDQSSITGESMPAEKCALEGNVAEGEPVPDKYRLYSGTRNGHGYMEILVTRDPGDTTLDRLIRMVEEAKKNKSYAQEFTQRFESYFVPVILGFIGILLLAFLFLEEPFSKSFYRAMTVMVVASPCALVISTPSAVLCGIARAAKMGVLIKGGKPLVDLGRLDTMVFDKTGTLTSGRPTLTDFIPIGDADESELVPAIVAMEEKSNHPLAGAIVAGLRNRMTKMIIPAVTDFKSLTGYGLRCRMGGEEWAIGNTELFIGLKGQALPDEVINMMNRFEREGKTTVLVGQGHRFRALLAILDTPREDNIKMVSDLRSIGVNNLIMLSGDRKFIAQAVGRHLGMDESYGDLLPEDKMSIVEQLVAQKKRVAMVGDGVNDAPAMSRSTVAIAMGAAGNDVALETADVALMSEQLDKLPHSITLSRRTRTVIRQNIFISLGVICVMIPLAIAGITSIGPAVAIHEGSTVAVVLNALRLLR
jgi:Cd2+/Zn2+-exporting ATPase